MGTKKATSNLAATLAVWSLLTWERAVTVLRWCALFFPPLIPLYRWALAQFAYAMLELADVNFGDCSTEEDDRQSDKLRANANKLLTLVGRKP